MSLVGLARDGAAIGHLAASDLDRPVPTCGDWTVRDVVDHLAESYRFWRDVVEHRRTAPDQVPDSARRPDEDAIVVYQHELAACERTLAQADPDAVHWTWAGPRNPSFVTRRLAHETAVHLWDIGEALGEPIELDVDLADDGVAEFVAVIGAESRRGPAVNGRVEFLVAETGKVYRTQGMGDADVVVSGPAADLLLVLWGRLPVDTVEVEGNAAVLHRYLDGEGLR
ncbi:MAG: maleylpyruvate isomerase family mycothiol-dependent enzyme [Ilumatobacteraceae bacterium]